MALPVSIHTQYKNYLCSLSGIWNYHLHVRMCIQYDHTRDQETSNQATSHQATMNIINRSPRLSFYDCFTNFIVDKYRESYLWPAGG